MMIVLTATLIAPALMATVQAAETTSAPAPLMTSKPLLEPAPPTESPSPAVQPPSSSVPVATPQSASPEHEVVMAWVGGKKITVEQFMNYIKKDTRLVVKATKAPGRAEILREMIVERLLEEAMLREDLLPKDRAPNSQEYMQAY
ncbi:MAG TPA: hypothetical protein DCS21_12805, partial [Gammaproteobacteria bacterium]|nr:hypothetical protein [Gammaproteobacteria bacterium]